MKLKKDVMPKGHVRSLKDGRTIWVDDFREDACKELGYRAAIAVLAAAAGVFGMVAIGAAAVGKTIGSVKRYAKEHPDKMASFQSAVAALNKIAAYLSDAE